MPSIRLENFKAYLEDRIILLLSTSVFLSKSRGHSHSILQYRCGFHRNLQEIQAPTGASLLQSSASPAGQGRRSKSRPRPRNNLEHWKQPNEKFCSDTWLATRWEPAAQTDLEEPQPPWGDPPWGDPKDDAARVADIPGPLGSRRG